MQIENILATIAVCVGATSLYLYCRLFVLEPEQSALIAKSKPGSLVIFFTTAPLFCLLMLGSSGAKVFASVTIWPVLLFLSWYNRRWLLANGADRAFVKRMFMLPAALSAVALAAFVAAVLLGFSVDSFM